MAGAPAFLAYQRAGDRPVMSAGTGTAPAPAAAGAAPPPLRAVARGGMANLAGAGFAGLAGFGVAALVARGLGPAAAGGFFAAIAGFGLVAGLAKLGTPTGLVYWIARFRAEGRPDLADACPRVAIRPVLVISAGLALVLWLLAPAWGGLVNGPAQDPGTASSVLRALAPFLVFAAFTDAALAATRGYHLMRPTVVLEKLLRPATQLLGLTGLAVLTLWTPISPVLWALLWALPYLPVALLAGYAARYARPEPPGHQPEPKRAADPDLAGRFWRFTAPRSLASVLHLSLQRVDIILVAVLAGPAAAAGYTVAGRFVLFGQLVNQAIGNSAQPRLADRLGAGDLAGTAALYRATTGWLVLTTWPLYLLTAVYAPLYLGLFGTAYRDAAPVVMVLAGAMLLASGCGTVDMLLAMAGRTTWNLANVALALTTMVAVTVLLVPQLGALGAAVGLAAAIAVNNLLPLAQVVYALRIHPFGAGTLTAAGLATTCFGLLPAGSVALFGTGPVGFAGTVTLCLGCYLAAARRLRYRLGLAALLPSGSLPPRFRRLTRLPRLTPGARQHRGDTDAQ